jgi:hypothetical protein
MIKDFIHVYRLYRKYHSPRQAFKSAYLIAIKRLPF